MNDAASAKAAAAGSSSMWVGRTVGLVSVVVGGLLALIWIAMRLSTAVLRKFAFIPFFDHKCRFDNTGLMITHLVVALLLIAVGLLILRRHRLAVPAFLLAGWGGLVFSAVALWPGTNLRSEMALGLKMAQRMGRVGPDATFMDLVKSQVPTGVFVILGLFLAIWLILLVAGSVHLLRRREEYRR